MLIANPLCPNIWNTWYLQYVSLTNGPLSGISSSNIIFPLSKMRRMYFEPSWYLVSLPFHGRNVMLFFKDSQDCGESIMSCNVAGRDLKTTYFFLLFALWVQNRNRPEPCTPWTSVLVYICFCGGIMKITFFSFHDNFQCLIIFLWKTDMNSSSNSKCKYERIV